jgi:Leucine-rich repeat (LRR) protein
MLRFKTRTLLILISLFSVVLGFLGREATQAFREQAAYRELLRRGAIGDDWPGWKEFYLGRKYAPIVDMSLPKQLSIREALPYLAHLDNLQGLDVNCESVDLEELQNLRSLNWIDSLRLTSAAVTDDSVSVLSQFEHLRWLHLKGTSITGGGRERLQAALPTCRIEL